MNTDRFLEDLRRRLLSDEPDGPIRADLRKLVIARLELAEPLSYCTKDNLARAIAALRDNAAAPGQGIAHPRLRFALLQYQLSLVPEEDRDLGHEHPDEIIEALTREMLLDAARAVP